MSIHRSNLSRSRCSASRRRSAFTLLELLLVLSILVVIGGIAVVNLTSVQEQSNVDMTTSKLNSIEQAIQIYQIRMNSLPETLKNLQDGPSDSAKKSRFGDSLIDEFPPTDAWGNEVVYSISGNEYELRSGGVDGQVNTDDDIVLEGS